MQKYKDSFEIRSSSLSEKGAGIASAVDDTKKPLETQKAPPPQFSTPRTQTSPIRTIATDLNDFIEKEKFSLAKQVTAKKEVPRPEPTIEAKDTWDESTDKPLRKKKSRLSIILLSASMLLFLFSAIFFISQHSIPIGSLSLSFPKVSISLPAFFGGSNSGTHTNDVEDLEEQPILEEGLVLIESKDRINIEGTFNRNASTFMDLVRERTASKAKPVLLFFTEDTLEGEGSQVRRDLSGGDLLQILGIPELTSISPHITDVNVGISSNDNLFFVMKINSYAEVYSRMLRGEEALKFRLQRIVHNRTYQEYGDTPFQDTTIPWGDARVLRTSQGIAPEDVLAWAIIDDTLIITETLQELQNLISRLH